MAKVALQGLPVGIEASYDGVLERGSMFCIDGLTLVRHSEGISLHNSSAYVSNKSYCHWRV